MILFYYISRENGGRNSYESTNLHFLYHHTPRSPNYDLFFSPAPWSTCLLPCLGHKGRPTQALLHRRSKEETTGATLVPEPHGRRRHDNPLPNRLTAPRSAINVNLVGHCYSLRRRSPLPLTPPPPPAVTRSTLPAAGRTTTDAALPPSIQIPLPCSHRRICFHCP